MPGTIVKAQDLSKHFRNYIKQPGFWGSVQSFYKRDYRIVEAVNNFSVEISEGEIVGLLGPNGAGKTTFMKMCTGLIEPSSGDLSVLGYHPFRRPVAFRKQIALVMGQKSQLWWDIPAHDSFLLLKSYYEVSNSEFTQRLEQLTTLLDVSHLLGIHVRRLSLGERMKMELIASLLHCPKVLFLDEPTIGLDVVAQRKLRAFIAEYQKEHGTTVLLTSHYMADVAALCTRIVLILDGGKKFDGSLGEFERILGREKFVTVVLSEAVNRGDELWQKFDPRWDDDGCRVTLRIPEEEFRDTIRALTESFPVSDISTDSLPIERVMHSLLESHTLEKQETANG